MRPTPAGRGGTARCCSPYNAILERLDTMDARIQQAVDDANAAMSAAVIQAGNAAQSASDALTQAGIAAGKASDAAADAADAAQDAADARQALDDINDTIQTTLDNELGGKVDKLTTAGLHLYSHTGSTQSEEEPIDGITANSIPIRDGNGRMHAADPASGATDKTLTTANWISQTGNSSPNNLVHRSGNETKSGKFTMDDGMIGYQNDWHQTNKSEMNLNDYCIFAKIPGGYAGRYLIIDFCQSSNTACAYGRLMLRRNASAIMPVWLYRKANGANNPLQSDSIHVLHDGTDIYLAWKKLSFYGSVFAALTFDISYGTVQKVSNQNMTWYTTAQMIVTNDISSYTDVTVVE